MIAFISLYVKPYVRLINDKCRKEKILQTPGRYLSRCKTLLPILLAAAATMDSVIPVGNHSENYR